MDRRKKISALTAEHVPEISRLHSALIPGLLRELDYPIIKIFYRTVIQFEYNFGFVHTEGNTVTGFVFGTTNRKKLYKDVALKRWLFLFICMLKLVLQKPNKIRLLIKIIFNRPHIHDGNCDSELVFLAVDPLYHRIGIGRNLMNHFHDYLIQKGISCYEASVEIENKSAQRFNEKLGFRLMYRYSEFGIERFRYSCDLSNKSR